MPLPLRPMGGTARKLQALALLVAQLGFGGACLAAPNFAGTWTVDLRTPDERARQAECGIATFTLTQRGDRVTGEHTMSTADCGRLNEGGEGTVSGIANGRTAVLVVTSGRNGAIKLGIARQLDRNRLRWQVRDEIQPGNPPSDSPLILQQGVLRRAPGGKAKPD